MGHQKFKDIITKEFLEEKLSEGLKVKEICKLIGCNYSTYRNIKQNLLDNIERKIGSRFGFVEILEIFKHNVRCKCHKCGNVWTTNNSHISKRTKSCGCGITKKAKANHSWKGYQDMSAQYFTNINNSSKKRRLEFDITAEYIWDLFIIQNKKCAFTGWDITLGRFEEQTASLDRKDSNVGYVVGNVQWVHKDVNRMKWILSDDRFIEICVATYKNRVA